MKRATRSDYEAELRQRAVDQIAANDILRLQARGTGTADPGGCGFIDNPIVTWDYPSAGKPILYIQT